MIEEKFQARRRQMTRAAVAPWAETVPEAPRLMTAADLLRLPDDARGYELVEGRLVRMSPTGTGHSADAATLTTELTIFVRAHQLGRVISSEAGFLISPPGEPETILAPDVAFVRADRVPSRESAEWEGYWRLAPDLVVEIASPSQSRAELAAKARKWLAAGTRLLWVIWPQARQVDVWRPGAEAPVTTLGLEDDLDGLDVLPGFRYAIAALFA
jgi:Uma2 family endonuclease